MDRRQHRNDESSEETASFPADLLWAVVAKAGDVGLVWPELLRLAWDAESVTDVERVGCELEALVREYQRIQELEPLVNVQRKVSEGAGRYGRHPGCVVIVQSSALVSRGIECFGLTDGELLQVSLSLGDESHLRVRRMVGELLGGPRMRRSRRCRRWGPEGCEMAWRYFMRFRHSLQWCEVCGDVDPDSYTEQILGISRLVATFPPESGEFRFVQE